jgi:hypothetical protein
MPRLTAFLALLLVTIALVPCGVPADGCDESGGAACTELCHLGCAVAPVPAVRMALAPLAVLGPARLEPVAGPLVLSLLPELPPPRT